MRLGFGIVVVVGVAGISGAASFGDAGVGVAGGAATHAVSGAGATQAVADTAVDLSKDVAVQRALEDRARAEKQAGEDYQKKQEELAADREKKITVIKKGCLADLRRAEAVSRALKKDDAGAIKALADGMERELAAGAATAPAATEAAATGAAALPAEDLSKNVLVQRALETKDKGLEQVEADYAKKVELLKTENERKLALIKRTCVTDLERAAAVSMTLKRTDEAETIKALIEVIQVDATGSAAEGPKDSAAKAGDTATAAGDAGAKTGDAGKPVETAAKPADADEKPAGGLAKYVGTWEFGDFEVHVHADKTADGSDGTLTGTWSVSNNGELICKWDNGWTDVIRQDGSGGYTKNAYAPGMALSGGANNTATASKKAE